MNRIKEDLVKLYNDEISWGECNSTYTEEEIREYQQSPLPSSLNVYVDFFENRDGFVFRTVDIPINIERERERITLLEDGSIAPKWDTPILSPLPFVED